MIAAPAVLLFEDRPGGGAEGAVVQLDDARDRAASHSDPLSGADIWPQESRSRTGTRSALVERLFGDAAGARPRLQLSQHPRELRNPSTGRIPGPTALTSREMRPSALVPEHLGADRPRPVDVPLAPDLDHPRHRGCDAIVDRPPCRSGRRGREPSRPPRIGWSGDRRWSRDRRTLEAKKLARTHTSLLSPLARIRRSRGSSQIVCWRASPKARSIEIPRTRPEPVRP